MKAARLNFDEKKAAQLILSAMEVEYCSVGSG
jgi:hypothetical protein